MMMNVLFYFLILVLSIFSTGLRAQALTDDIRSSINSNIAVDSILVEILAEEFLKKTNLPGISIAVSKDENIVYAKGFGYANVEKKLQMTSTTRLRAASVSKVIAATALGRLLSEGKIDLDAPIKKYIPYIDSQYANITTRQLAGHTSGMDHRPKGNSHKKKQFTSTKPMVELMDKPLLFEPDTDYKYSTHGFVLLGAVIEGASGVPFETYMRDEIFKPLNMVQTAAENIEELTENDAQVYYLKKGKLQKQKWTNTSYNLPGAGFRSTPTDLLKMMNAYTNGFISKQTVEEMFKSHQLKNGEKTNVGLAWRNSYDAFGHKTIEHAGNWLGARTVVVHYPLENMNIAIMINAGRQILIEETAHIFADLFRGHEKTEPELPNLNTTIGLTFRSNGKVEEYNGNITLGKFNGILTSNQEGFLKSNSIHYLGYGNHYTTITDYGLLYLNLDKTSNLKGELYVYSTMNKTKPTGQNALVSFESLDK